MNKFIISFLVLIIFSACDKQKKEEQLDPPLVFRDGLFYSDSLSTTPFTGRHKSKMLNMKIEYEVLNGIRQGDFIVYYANDNIQMRGRMKDNMNDGEWKYFYENGEMQSVGFFELDKPIGQWVWFDSTGRKLEQGKFNSGKREGDWKNFDSTGKIIMIRTYIDNKLVDSIEIN